MRRKILLINPAYYEFGDYGYHDMPAMGLLKIGRYFKNKGLDVEFLDCNLPIRLADTGVNLKEHYNKAPFVRMIKCGNFSEEGIMKPQKYYGLSHTVIRHKVKEINPTEIWLTTGLTYYWEAVKDIALICKEEFPHIPLLLGGIYATLAPEHANKHIPVDYIHIGPLEDIDELMPDYSLDNNRNKCTIRTIQLGKGCNVNPPCSFCSVVTLDPKFVAIKAKPIFSYILDEYNKGVNSFRFWASQLLVPQDRFISLMRLIIEAQIKIKMVASEGVQPDLYTEEIAHIMKQAGFTSVSIPMESISSEKIKDFRKPSDFNDYEMAVINAQKANTPIIKSFIMLGVPDQNYNDIIHAIVDCWARDVLPALHQYTPIPGSYDWDRYKQFHNKPLEELHPSLWPGACKSLMVKQLEEIKRVAKLGLNRFNEFKNSKYIRCPEIWDCFSYWIDKYKVTPINKPLVYPNYKSAWTIKCLS